MKREGDPDGGPSKRRREVKPSSAPSKSINDRLANARARGGVEGDRRRAGAPPGPPSGGAPPGPPRQPDQSAGPPGGYPVHAGMLCAWDSKKGFGFIKCPDIPEDVFVPREELPPELQGAQRREDVIDQRVEFELKTMPKDGKLRALRCQLIGQGYPGPPMPPPQGMPPPGYGGEPWRHLPVGRIRRFNRSKGFGFLEMADGSPDVFFMPSSLPKDMKDSKDTFEGVEMTFEVNMHEGKPRAGAMQRYSGGGGYGPPPMGPPMGHMGMGHMGPMMGPPMGHMGGPMWMGPPMGPPMVPMGPMGKGMGPMGGMHPGPPGRCVGRIIKYEDAKGYGFIASHVVPEDIFFMKSSLPKEKQKATKQELIDLDVSFDWYYNEEGKPRGQALELLPPMQEGGPMGHRAGAALEGVHTGIILRFEPKKGYGFLKPDDLNEDVFFLRSELPIEIRDAQSKDEVANREVEFEIQSMPDGKLRANRLELTAAGRSDEGRPKPAPENREAQSGRVLDPALLDEMVDFLRENGGTYDYGRFANKFQGIKKKQLEEHFNVVDAEEKGHHRVELREELIGERMEPEGDAEGLEAQGAPNMDDPAIPLGPGCSPHGIIRSYDPLKGFGFILSAGYGEDIYFPRSALPTNFQGKSARDMPNLAGVQVSFDFTPQGDKPRADKVVLLLKWEPVDRCWLLKRDTDPTMD